MSWTDEHIGDAGKHRGEVLRWDTGADWGLITSCSAPSETWSCLPRTCRAESAPCQQAPLSSSRDYLFRRRAPDSRTQSPSRWLKKEESVSPEFVPTHNGDQPWT